MTSRNRVKLLTVLMGLAFAAGTLLAAPAAAQTTCNNGTLSGGYAFHAHGFAEQGQPEFPVPVAAALPVALQGNIAFDGNGNITNGIQKNMVGGHSGGFPFVGSYTVNDDCTGTITRVLPNGFHVHWRIEVVKGGTEILFLYLEHEITIEGTIIKR